MIQKVTQMKKRRKRPSEKLLIVVMIISVVLVGAYINTVSVGSEENAVLLWQSVIVGVFCSIIASGFLYVIQSSVDVDNNENVLLKLEEIDKRLEQQKDLYDNGVVSIRRKSFYDGEDAFWSKMIESASDQLDLIGRDIYPWFNHNYRTVFIEKIKSMIKNKKNVRIILSDDGFVKENVYAVERGEQDYNNLSNVEKTCYELRQVYKEIKSKNWRYKGNLNVYIADQKPISYMYIRTDVQCVISPYVNDGDSFLLELKTGDEYEYSQFLDSDFESMLNSSFVKKFELGDNHERVEKGGRRKFLFGK